MKQKKLTYKEKQKQEERKSKVKFGFAVGGFVIGVSIFAALMSLWVKGCEKRKQKQETETNTEINREGPKRNILGQDIYEGGSGQYYIDNEDRAEMLDKVNPLSSSTYSYSDYCAHLGLNFGGLEYYTWGGYSWTRTGAQAGTWYSYIPSTINNLVYGGPWLKMYELEYSLQNHHIGEPNPLCYISYTEEQFYQINTQTFTQTYTLENIVKVELTSDRFLFTYEDNGDYSIRSLEYARFSQNGWDNSNLRITHKITSFRLDFYRWCEFQLTRVPDYANEYGIDELKNLIYCNDVSGYNIFYYLDLFMAQDKYYIMSPWWSNVYPLPGDDNGEYYQNNNHNDEVYDNEYLYWSSDTSKETYTLGQPPQDDPGGDTPGGDNPGSEGGGSLFDVFSLMSLVFSSIMPFLGYQIIPGITIGTFVALPLILIAVLFIVKMFKR